MTPSRLCCVVVAVTVVISTCRTCRCDWYQRFWNGADSEWCICPRLTVAEHDQKTGESYIYFTSNINHDKRTTGSAHTCLLLPEDIAECNKICTKKRLIILLSKRTRVIPRKKCDLVYIGYINHLQLLSGLASPTCILQSYNRLVFDPKKRIRNVNSMLDVNMY
jgi:hypothetical protein